MGSLNAAEFESFLVDNYCSIAATALIFYDSVLTTQDEMRFFWTKKLTGATVLFCLNKWLTVLVYAINFIGFFQVSDSSVLRFLSPLLRASVKIEVALSSWMYSVWGLFTALRTYALCKNWFIPMLILLLHAAPIGVNMTPFAFQLGAVILPRLGCQQTDLLPSNLTKLYATVTVISRTSLILANGLAIGATWFAMQRHAGFSSAREFRTTLAGVLLWDGFIYFIALALIDSVHMTITLLSISQLVKLYISDIGVFSFPLSSILISRFMLNLQQANSKTTGAASSHWESTAINSVIFERAFGSLGASISPDNYFAAEEDNKHVNVEENNAERVEGQEGLAES